MGLLPHPAASRHRDGDTHRPRPSGPRGEPPERWNSGEESLIEPTTPARPSPEAILKIATDILEDRKADDVVVIDLAGKSTIADYMVVATGQSHRQVVALADNLLRAIKGQGLIGVTPEGVRQGDWVLIDAGDVIIHLFRPEVRDFYNLEKMWGVSYDSADRTSGANA